jgi:iron complex outermembrane receptor protein
VVGSSFPISSGSLDITAGANFNKSSIDGTTKTTDKLPVDAFGKTFFIRTEESRIVAGQPNRKLALLLNYKINKFNAMLRGTNFGQFEIWDASNVALDEVQTPKTAFDLSLGYQLLKKATLTLAVNSLTDFYPDKIKNAGNSSAARFIYSRNITQFGLVEGIYYWFKNRFIT